jgi:hypothetical protein
MPGGYSDLDADAFEPSVVKGLRAAGLALLVFAGIQVALWLFGGLLSLSILVDAFLGVQLFRLRHSWKLWALVRAWGGILLAVVGFATSRVDLVVLVGLQVGAQLAYCVALILFLTGTPSSGRLLTGRASVILALVLLVAAVFWATTHPVTAAITR